MFRSSFVLKLGLGVALIMGLGVGRASADLFDFTLTAGNTGLTGYTGPFGAVDVNLDPSKTMATITLSSLQETTSPFAWYLFGDGSSLALNVSGTFTVGTISFSQAGLTGFSAPSFTADTSANQNVDDQGKFNLTINNTAGYPEAVNQIVVTLTNTGGTWASAASVLTGNGKITDGTNENLAAAHIFVSPTLTKTDALTTGFAGGVGPPPQTPGSVPEPSTLAIAGLGALGFVAYGLRKRMAK